jgi:Rps23 Pro-64 3,4-dihydroxylase Tpa1-like proline 4-hydroxylase
MNNLLQSIYNVFSEKECNDLINVIEKLGFNKASLFTDVDGIEHYHTDVRNSMRKIIDNRDFAQLLEERIYKYIPKTYNDLEYHSINYRFRFLKYEKGGFFARHKDNNYKNKDSISLITILIYLNEDYEGGYTTFFANVHDKEGLSLKPKTGMISLMDQDIGHYVPELTDGIKYVIRTELMYSGKSKYHLPINQEGPIKIMKLN